MGEDSIPDVPVKLNVMEFGAKGDGMTDDSQAFLDAIEGIEDGAIYIPPGRYRITQVLEINKSNVVLRGAGAEETVLFFPNHLGEILGPGNAPEGTPFYSWTGGLITLKGGRSARQLANVVSEASRGEDSIEVSSTSRISPGQRITLRLKQDPDGSLLRHLHAEELDGGNYSFATLVQFVSRVVAIKGNTIVLDRPLPTNVHLNWEPSIYDFGTQVTEVGIENLTIEFPQVRYSGHHKEFGYNGIEAINATNCWVRNLKFKNVENGIFFRRAQFCTIKGVEFSAYEGQAINIGRYGDSSGHHAIQVAESYDNLITEFAIDAVYVHDLTVATTSRGNVFSKGRGIDLAFDHHIRVPFENLFTDIDVGIGGRIWLSAGDNVGTESPHSGARETFWNIRAGRSLNWPSHSPVHRNEYGIVANQLPWGPDQLTLIGLTTINDSIMNEDGQWFEVIDPDKLFPQNLHLAQLARRLRDRTGP